MRKTGPSRRARARRLPLLLASLVAACAVSARASDCADPRTCLREHFGLGSDDLERLDQGQVVSRQLEAAVDREVAVLGVVRVAVPLDSFVAQVDDIERFKQGEEVLAIG